MRRTIMILNLRSFTLGSLAAVVSLMILSGCGQEKKMEPVPVGEMQEYKDPGIGFSFNHPVGWVVNAEVGRVHVCNAQDVDKKFLDPTSVGTLGVQIAVEVTKNSNATAYIKDIKDEWAASGFQLGQEQGVTVDGKSGTKLPFTANYGGGNIIYGHRIFVPVDSMLYDFTYSGFGEFYNAYAGIFDASLSSFKLPIPKEKARDETLPSLTFSTYDAKTSTTPPLEFSFEYPENFNFSNTPKGKNDLVLELHGYRQDCSIRFDVFGAQGLTVEKVFEQNKSKYRAKSTGKMTIGGEPASYVAYSPAAQVESRAYFAVKNDKVVRIIMNWYKPQETDYLAAYDKVLASIKFK